MKGHQKDVEKMAKGFQGDTSVLFYSFINVQVNPNLKPKGKITKTSKIGLLKNISSIVEDMKRHLGEVIPRIFYEALEEKGYFKISYEIITYS